MYEITVKQLENGTSECNRKWYASRKIPGDTQYLLKTGKWYFITEAGHPETSAYHDTPQEVFALINKTRMKNKK